MTSPPHRSLGSLLQEALFHWPTEADTSRALAQQLVAEARAASSAEPASGWAAELVGLTTMTSTERAVLLARGLRWLAAGVLVPVVHESSGTPAALEADPALLKLRGCGPRTAERLASRGLRSPRDLLDFLPVRYEDRRKVVPLSAVQPGQSVLTRGRVTHARFLGRHPRRFFEVRVVDGESTLACRWYRVWPGLAQRAPLGAVVVVAGTAREYRGQLQMAHPTIRALEPGEAVGAEGIVPRYAAVEGVAPAVVRTLCAQVASQAERLVPEPLIEEIRSALGLPGRSEAYRLLHLPSVEIDEAGFEALEAKRSDAHLRLMFDVLLVSQLALTQRRQDVRTQAALACPPSALPAELFPFELTRAQARVIREISEDLVRPVPMQRLVQGDVGSGKTAVAFAAAAQVMDAGGQVALMAPTEILAAQHHATLAPWMERIGRRLALLTAGTARGARESTLALLASGDLPLVVGTHALIAERVAFSALGLVIVDEQHRFGVAQRASLRAKGVTSGGHSPHLLVMTATPIPRTLALTVYGDLDLSVVDELPPGRVGPKTHVLPASGRSAVYSRVLEHLARGRKVFVVCPLVAESEALDVADAERTHADLVSRLAPHRVGLLHGRLAAPEKDAVLKDFRDGHLAALVATSVVEVGVDVPDADLMVVESAERFGLSQLHQLRGRIGRRAGAESLCILLVDPGATTEAQCRLRVMEETTDGFRIAEEDLRLRGPGELLGLRQAGVSDLGLAAAATHPRLLTEARALAREILSQDPGLSRPEHAVIRELLEARLSGPIFGEDAG